MGEVTRITDGMAWSVKRLAEAWDCSTSAVYAMIEDGSLQTFNIGKRGIRISDEEKRRCESANRKTIETETSPSDDAAGRRLPLTAMKMVSGIGRG